MFRLIRHWYYKRLFFKIYFQYLAGPNPQNAINDAFEDIRAIKLHLNEI